MTRTYTRYFSEDNEHVVALRAAILALEGDWSGRQPYIDPDVYEAGARRLEALDALADLLTERVPE